MVLGLFKKHCPICGMVVEKETGISRFGKNFCSEEDAEEYRKKMASEQSKSAKSGGCC